MEPIDAGRLRRALSAYAGSECYLHVEFCRGGFVRNVRVRVLELALRGDGPYRLGIRCDDDGWVVMEGLTHWATEAEEPLFLCALEEDQKLAHLLQIHTRPMEA